jgi:hypothetical protein
MSRTRLRQLLDPSLARPATHLFNTLEGTWEAKGGWSITTARLADVANHAFSGVGMLFRANPSRFFVGRAIPHNLFDRIRRYQRTSRTAHPYHEVILYDRIHRSHRSVKR